MGKVQPEEYFPVKWRTSMQLSSFECIINCQTMAIKQFISSIARKRGIIHFSRIFSILISCIIAHRQPCTLLFTRLCQRQLPFIRISHSTRYMRCQVECHPLLMEGYVRKLYTSWWDLIFLCCYFRTLFGIRRTCAKCTCGYFRWNGMVNVKKQESWEFLAMARRTIFTCKLLCVDFFFLRNFVKWNRRAYAITCTTMTME